MKIFSPIHRQYVSPIELQTLDKTLGTLEQGHKEAVKAASDLQVAIANMPIHESEAPYRQAKLAEIKDKIAAGTIYGNSAGALDDIIGLTGDLSSDQGLIGRIESNKQYQDYHKRLNERQDLGELDKEYFRQLNPYRHTDKIDPKTGKVIGYEAFKPNRTPVSTTNWNKLFEQGMRYAAKEAGGGDNIVWKGADGSVTKNPTENSMYYSKSSGKWERLTKEKIRAGVMAALKGDPLAMQSVAQDFEVANWDHKRTNGKSSLSDSITNPDGGLIDLDSYIRKKIAPLEYAASYNNVFTSTDISMNPHYNKGGGDGNGRGRGLGTGQGVVPGGNFIAATTINGGQDKRGTFINTGEMSLARARANFVPAQRNYNNVLKSIGAAQVEGLGIQRRSYLVSLLDKKGIKGIERQKAIATIDAYNEAHNAMLKTTDRDNIEHSLAAYNLSYGNFTADKNNKTMQKFRKYLDTAFSGGNIYVDLDHSDPVSKKLIAQYKRHYKTIYGKDVVVNSNLRFNNDEKGKRLLTLMVDNLADDNNIKGKINIYNDKGYQTNDYNIDWLGYGKAYNFEASFADMSKVKRMALDFLDVGRFITNPNVKSQVVTHGGSVNAFHNQMYVNSGAMTLDQYKTKTLLEDEGMKNALANINLKTLEGAFTTADSGNYDNIPDNRKMDIVNHIRTAVKDNKLSTINFAQAKDVNGYTTLYMVLDMNEITDVNKTTGNGTRTTRTPTGTVMIPLNTGTGLYNENAEAILQGLQQGVRKDLIRTVPDTNVNLGSVNDQDVSITSTRSGRGMKYYVNGNEVDEESAVQLYELGVLRQQALINNDGNAFAQVDATLQSVLPQLIQ